MGVEARDDEVHQVGDTPNQRSAWRLLLQLLDEELRRRVTQHRAIGQDVGQVLGKGRLARPKEARDPDTESIAPLLLTCC